MAYDGYRQSPGPYDQTANPPQPTSPTDPHFSTSTPPYPSHYGPDRLNMPRPQMPPAPQSQPPNPDPAWQQPQPQTGRINEAVNSAYSQADSPSYLPPEVLSHITANVIQQLKATGLDNLQGQPPPPPPPPQHPPAQFQPQPQQQWPPASGPIAYSEAPPPPGMAAQNPWPAQPPSQYPPPPQQPWPPASGPMPPYGETQPVTGQYQGPAQPPNIITENIDTQPYQTPGGYSTSPRPGSKSSSVPQPERRASPFNQESSTSQGSERNYTGEARANAPSRDTTRMETTTLERVWGRFFDNGKPTDRLGQFLRGIAVHLIQDYSPGDTIVIVPEKMQQFYKDTRVESDSYPWQDIFDDRTSSISRLFRNVEAEHHLVQEKSNLRPDIPGLTPRGFQQWATLMIQAHPEREYERLQKVVLNMPISNPDDKRERFPKEIPQRLFPEVPNLALRERIDESIMRHCHLELPPISDEEISKAAHRPGASKGPTRTHGERGHGESSLHERGRQPHNTSTSAVVDDEEESLSPHPLERARKPYSAQPGGGKVYDEAGASQRGHNGSFSTSPKPKEDFLSSSPKHRLSDIYNQESPYARAGGSGARRFTKNPRSRSSSRGMNARGDYRSSESELLDRDGRYPGMPPTSEYYYDAAKSNLPGDMGEDGRRYRDLDQDAEDKRFRDSIRERERSKYQERLHRSSWPDDEEYYGGGR